MPNLAMPILASLKEKYSILYTHKLQLYIRDTRIFQKSLGETEVLYITQSPTPSKYAPHPHIFQSESLQATLCTKMCSRQKQTRGNTM
jgi:hypothetical protein